MPQLCQSRWAPSADLLWVLPPLQLGAAAGPLEQCSEARSSVVQHLGAAAAVHGASTRACAPPAARHRRGGQ